jgi:hypothetical protein
MTQNFIARTVGGSPCSNGGSRRLESSASIWEIDRARVADS